MTLQLKILRCTAVLFVTGLLAALLIIAAPPSFASLTVIDAEDESPGGHFTEFTMVPGDTQSTTVLLAQHTEGTVYAGVRLDPLAASVETHETIEITVEGLGSTQTLLLTEIIEMDGAVWLGELPPHQHHEVTITADFPFSAGNETQGTVVPFQLTFTAQQPAPETVPGETNDRADPEQEAAGNPNDPRRDGQLPETGSPSFFFGILALGLLLTGLATFQVARKPRRIGTQS